jgi:hypothetical protein
VSRVEGLPQPGSFGAVFEDFMRAMTLAAQRPEPAFTQRHMSPAPVALADVGQQLDDGSPDSGAFPAMVHAMRAAGMPVPPRRRGSQ